MTDTQQEPQHLTISEAAEAAGVHRRAIRRCLDAGELPNAYRAVGPLGQRTWNIPVSDLLAAGLQIGAPRATNGHAVTADEPIDLREVRHETSEVRRPRERPSEIDDLRDELEELREELADERTQRLVAEAVANERGRALERADNTIRSLTSRIGAPEPAATNGHTNGDGHTTPMARPRWWKAPNLPNNR